MTRTLPILMLVIGTALIVGAKAAKGQELATLHVNACPMDHVGKFDKDCRTITARCPLEQCQAAVPSLVKPGWKLDHYLIVLRVWE